MDGAGIEPAFPGILLARRDELAIPVEAIKTLQPSAMLALLQMGTVGIGPTTFRM